MGDIHDSTANIAGGDIHVTNIHEEFSPTQRNTIRSIAFYVSALAGLLIAWIEFPLQFFDVNRSFRLPTRLLFSVFGLAAALLALGMHLRRQPLNRWRIVLIWLLIVRTLLFNGLRLLSDTVMVAGISVAPELIYDENDTGTYRDASTAYLQRGQWELYSGNYEKASVDLNRAREISTSLAIHQNGESSIAPPVDLDTVEPKQRELYHWLLFMSLKGLRLNGIDLSPESDHHTLEVEPGGKINGQGVVEVYLDSTARLITPVVLTASWDDSIRDEIADGLDFVRAREFGAVARSYYFSVDVAAPGETGTYYLIIVSGAMYNIQQILTFDYSQNTGMHDIWHVPVDSWHGKTYGGSLDHSFLNFAGQEESYKWPVIAIEIHVKE